MRAGVEIHHLGAFHGSEVPYVLYDDFELVGAERELSASMATYYTSFAASGDPNTRLGRLADVSPEHAELLHDPCEFRRDCHDCTHTAHGGSPRKATHDGCVWCPTMQQCHNFSKLLGSCTAANCIAAPKRISHSTCAHTATSRNCPTGGHRPPYGPMPPPPPPQKCDTPQAHAQWPRFTGGSDAKFIDFNLCNISVQAVAPFYRSPQCDFWEKLCR